ncbi:protein kinase [Perkinsela sp. CCAP 1560/4]|nr:protein kinase [Perkinsela sp. CCAP 1560/4]KNH08865.1 protein kinase [Perkinsela sp. CCAP 1560/4]|eukprot:KNH06746.1 protein kinase [Perkinsela sp. CCAP 1560/4]
MKFEFPADVKPIKCISESSESSLILCEKKVVHTDSSRSSLGTQDYSHQRVLKIRFPKLYRHPVLDTRLRRHRTKVESKVLKKCETIQGIKVPAIYQVDVGNSAIHMQYVSGLTIAETIKCAVNKEASADEGKLSNIWHSVGFTIGSLHSNDIIHGDLTLSNFIIQDKPAEESSDVCVVDFGLAFVSRTTEDKAVDLYSFERCVNSVAPLRSNDWIDQAYKGYELAATEKQFQETMRKLEQVRLRGRKRSMLG